MWLSSTKELAREELYYAPFVRTFNRALLYLDTCAFPSLRPPPGTFDILFYRNDPKTLHGAHGGPDSLRKPDVVLVSYGSAMRAGKDDHLADEKATTAIDVAPEEDKERKNFAWQEVLVCFEHKHPKPKRFQPSPKTYSAVLSEISQKLPALHKIEALIPQEEPEQASTPSDSQPSAEPSAAVARASGSQRQSLHPEDALAGASPVGSEEKSESAIGIRARL